MVDIRKIIIIFVVAILFSILVFAVIGAVYPEPRHEDYCKTQFFPREKPLSVEPKCENPVEPTIDEQKACDEKHGFIDYRFDSRGCSIGFECSTCQYELEQAQKKYNQYKFYISAALALIAVFLGMFLPYQANTLNEWIGTGFMLGGTFALFFGTATTYTSLDRYVKPIVIFLELALVILIAYKQVGKLREDKKGRKK